MRLEFGLRRERREGTKKKEWREVLVCCLVCSVFSTSKKLGQTESKGEAYETRKMWYSRNGPMMRTVRMPASARDISCSGV